MEIIQGLPIMNMDLSETNCCPRFEPEKWDRKIMELSDLPMVKASTKSLLHIPLNMDKVMRETMEAITDEGAECKDKYLILSHDVSQWKCDHYFLVEKPVERLENVNFSGRFLTMVFEGDYGQIPKWIPQLEQTAKDNQFAIKSIYAFYTTCPKCAKVYGKNYVVLFGELAVQ